MPNLSDKNYLDLIGRSIVSMDENQNVSSCQNTSRQFFHSRRSLSLDFSKIIPLLEDFEEENIQKHSKFVIKKASRFKLVFDSLIDLFVIYSVTSSLFYLSFFPDGEREIALDILLSFAFFIDFILSFFTEYIDKKNRHIMNLPMIAKHYASTWMIPDFFSMLPLKYTGNPNTEYTFRLFRIGKIGRLYHLVNIKKIGSFLGKLFYKNQHRKKRHLKLVVSHIWDLFQELSAMLIVTYTLACIWWFYSGLIKRRMEEPESFIESFGLENEGKYTQLIKTWYFTFSTMMTVGYGDFTAKNTYEMGLSIIILIIGPSWFAFTMGKAINTIKTLKEIDGETDLAGQLAIWLSNIDSKYKIVPSKIKSKINKYYLNYWKNDRLGKMANISNETDSLEQIKKIQDPYLEALPESMKKEVVNYIFDDIFEDFRYFFGRKRQDWEDLFCLYLKPRTYLEGETILDVQKKIHELFFMKTGQVCISTVNNGEFAEVLKTTENIIIGDYFLFHNISSFLLFKAGTTVHGFWIPAEIVEKIVDKKSDAFKFYLSAISENYQILEENSSNILETFGDDRRSLFQRNSVKRVSKVEKTITGEEHRLKSLDTLIMRMKVCRKGLIKDLKEKLADLAINK